MATTESMIQTFVDTNPVFQNLSEGEKQQTIAELKDFLIPDTGVYRILVIGVVLALLASVVIIGLGVLHGSDSDTALTAAVAIATGCFGGLVGALSPQKG